MKKLKLPPVFVQFAEDHACNPVALAARVLAHFAKKDRTHLTIASPRGGWKGGRK